MGKRINFINKVFSYGLLIAFLIIFCYIIFTRYKLKSDYQLSNANITSVGKVMSKEGNWLIEYSYSTIDGHQVKGGEYFPLILPQAYDLTGRRIPVAYSTKDQDYSQLLILKETWAQYGLNYPDSLSWLKTYIDLKKIIYSY